jgi:hypothetical protein
MPATDSVALVPFWHFDDGLSGAGLHSSAWTQQQSLTVTVYVPF